MLNAQQEIDYFSLSLEELLKVEVTGPTLTSESLKTVPAAVTIFSHAQIKAMAFDNLDELINVVPGFQSYRSAQNSHHYPFSSRGRRISTSSAEILVLVDGQRLNEPHTGGVSNIISGVPFDNIERIEFIRGPGAAIYGSNAMMGVINIITRSEVSELKLGLGYHSRGNISVLSNHHVGELLIDIFAKIDKDNGASYQVLDTVTDAPITTHDPAKFSNLNVKLQHNNTFINIQHGTSYIDEFYIANFITDIYKNKQSEEFDYITVKQNFNWYSMESWAWFSYIRAKAKLSRHLTLAGAFAVSKAPPGSIPIHFETERTNSELRLQLHNDWVINKNNQFQFGAELRFITVPESDLVIDFDMADANSIVLRTRSERDIVGVYGQYQSTPFEKSHLTLGLRYDDFSNIGSQLSPRFGWVQELGDKQSIKFLYGEAFRSPAESELNSVNNTAVVGRPNLQAETVKSVDLIWFASWSAASLSAGYFENQFENAIVQVTVDRTLQYINLANDDHTRGYEFEFTYKLSEQLLLQGTYTHITDKPDSAFREADQFGSVSLNYLQGSWNTNLVASYYDTRDMLTRDGERVTLNDYWKIFGKVSFLLSQKWETYLKVTNLSDKTILSPPSFPRGIEATPSRGREVMIGILVHW